MVQNRFRSLARLSTKITPAKSSSPSKTPGSSTVPSHIVAGPDKTSTFSSAVNKKTTPAPATNQSQSPRKTRFNKPTPTNRPKAPLFPRKVKTFKERKYGYGNLDDWNALPETDQTRIRDHSKQLLHAFARTKWFLLFLGRFPFKATKLEDGSYVFILRYCSISYILFCFTTLIIVALCFMFTVGFLFIYLDIFTGDYNFDRCGNTWGQSMISRNMPAVIFVWSQLALSAAGSLYIITHSNHFLEFYNVVNEAVMQLDVDPTERLFALELKGSISFLFFFATAAVIFSLKKSRTLDEIPLFVIQAICFFFYPDIYLAGSKKTFTAKDYQELLPKCKETCKECYEKRDNLGECESHSCYNHINHPTKEYELYKWIGFFIIAYAMLAARTLLRQLEFFCQVLVNLASTWNKRFVNYCSTDNTVNRDDPYRRRLGDTYMLKDHYEIVHLYNVAEGNFSFILFVYYAFVFLSLFSQFYYTALLSTQVTCAEAVHRERQVALREGCDETGDINVTQLVLESGLSLTHGVVVSFEDACFPPDGSKTDVRHASVSNICLLVYTLFTFINTTVEVDRASHQADVGFYRVRKRGYLGCRTRNERNTMHSLVFSFTGPKQFVLTAAGYFPIRKKTIVVVIAVAFIYFLIILSFKPFMVSADDRCYTLVDGIPDYKVKYPPVI